MNGLKIDGGIELNNLVGGPLISENHPQIENSKKNNEIIPGKEWLGYFYQGMFIIIQCLNQFFGKMLFIRHPSLSLTQLIVLRSTLALIILVTCMNVKTKYYLMTSIPKESYRTLAMRCAQGSFGFMCLYTSIKYFPLVITSLVQNTTPVLTAYLQYKLKQCTLSTIDKSTLAASFLGIIVLITGTISQSKEISEETQQSSANSYSYLELLIPCICLFLMPFNGAVIQIFLRDMRNLSEFTLTTYIVLTMFFVYTPIFLMFETLDVYYNFTIRDWIISILLGFTSSSMQFFKVRAIKYEEPSRLSILNYFQPIMQLILDVIFFQNMFTTQQIFGAGIVFAANSISWGIKIKKSLNKKSIK